MKSRPGTTASANTCGVATMTILAATFHAHAVQANDGPTFNRDIAPIVHAHCGECHRPGGLGPFSLLTYDDVKKRDRQVVQVTGSGFMPPWLPEPTGPETALHGERRLSQSQIEQISKWVSAGSPEGEGAAPAPPKYSDSLSLGKPDFTVTLDKPYIVPAQTDETIRTFVFPVVMGLSQYVKAIDLRCENPRVVHHAMFSIDMTGQAARMDQADDEPGYPSMGDIGLNLAGSFGAWSPAATDVLLPEGVARVLLKKCDLVLEVHFNPTGKPEEFKPEIGFYFSRENQHRAVTLTMGSFWLDIAAGESSYIVRDEMVTPVDLKLIGLTPQARYLCRRMNVTATLPGGERMELLRIDDWDFNWLQEYRFQTPIDLPAQTRIELEYVYDNSADNPRNPHVPPQRVQSGGKATNEMAILFLTVIAADEKQRPELEQANTTLLLDRMKKAKDQRHK